MSKRRKGDVIGQKRRWHDRYRGRENLKRRLGRPRTFDDALDTRRVFYVLGYGNNIAPCKIGITIDLSSLRGRMRSIQCGNPRPLMICHVEEIKASWFGATLVETRFKHMAHAFQCDGGTEWFNLRPWEANHLVQKIMYKALVIDNPLMKIAS